MAYKYVIWIESGDKVSQNEIELTLDLLLNVLEDNGFKVDWAEPVEEKHKMPR